MLSASKESHLTKDSLTEEVATSSATIVEPSTSSFPLILEKNPLGNDNAQDVDIISTKKKINKQNSASKSSSSAAEKNDSPREIAAGNCVVVGKGEKSDEKINTPKKRFFDLKRTAESATNKISSISQSRLAQSLTPKLRRKSATNHKLSQLERQSNLFIRDGSESKINKPEEATMETGTDVNAKHQQNSVTTMASGREKSKKSLLGSSFPFKIAASGKGDEATKCDRKTGPNPINLCRNFSSESKAQLKLKTTSTSDAFGNYEEIDIVNEENDDDGKRQNMITNVPDARNDNRGRSNCMKGESSSSTAPEMDGGELRNTMEQFENFSPEKKQKQQQQQDDGDKEEFNSIESCGGDGGEPRDIVSKPEFNSNLFKNIPVRPRKGQVPHMENYCLFDPSVDFCNEKELRKHNFATQSTAGFNFTSKNFRNFHLDKETIVSEQNQNQQQQQLVYDVSEHDEQKAILAHHNYYEIDPELLEQDEATAAELIDCYPLKCADQGRVSIITQMSRKSSSSSSSSCDYPSLFNSVVETTPSSTITLESTDESNICVKLNDFVAPELSNPSAANAINHTNVIVEEEDEDVIVISSVVTTTGAKKKSPQFDRIVKQTARNSPTSANNANQQQTMGKGKSTKINLPFHNEILSFDPLKPSHSLPQLQSMTVRQEQIADGDYKIEINNRTTIRLRRNRVRAVRPLSSESLDSGFTTPSPPNEATPLAQSRSNSSVADNNRVDNSNSGTKEPVKSESTVLTQCDNIQQLIEIYTEWANYYLERHKSKRKVVDLSVDARDGLLLAEIVEAVTGFKVPDLIKKPKTQQQMYDNVEACLNILRHNSVPGVENVTANDIIGGRLKAVLSLFFSLSRYKQASKLKAPGNKLQQAHSSSLDMMHATRQLPVYTKTANGATAIPMPSTVLVTRRCPPDKIRPLPPTPNHQSSIPLTKTSSNESTRPNSPPDNNQKNGIRSNCKIPSSPYALNGSLLTSGNVEEQNQQTPVKQSMLGKLKLFGKDKTEIPKTQLSKRTSSSSGFSSARSERSDSSISLNNDSNIPSSQTTSTSSTKSNTKKPDTAKITVTTSSTKPTSKVPAPAKTSTKGDKKDKSQLNGNQPENNGINADTLPTKLHKIPQAKLQVQVGRKPETTKTGSSSQLQQPKSLSSSTQSASVGTSIPKPMAAIKGTTKLIENGDVRQFDVIKVDKSSVNGLEMVVQKTQIVNPITMSPLHNQLLNQTNNNSSVTSMTDSIHSTSTNNHSNSSESSVIYRPAGEAHADIYQMQSHSNPIPNRKLENFNDPSLINGHKFHTLSPKVNGMVQASIATTIFEEDKDVSSIVPMRSLMRGGYNSCTTSPLRTSRIGNGYFEDGSMGYCSDGDALRKASSAIRYSDIENGYLSEGPHFLSILRNNRPQMPSTIAEERCQTSREGNLDSADMESNSSKNSHGRDYWGNQQQPSPTSSRKDKTSSPSHSRRSTPSAKSSRTKGVPQNFGYIKRTNGSSTATDMQTNAMLVGGRTAHVSAVPRSNKLKVSGGTQTTTADFQQKMQQSPQYRSFSLTGPGAAQLSQSVKERFGSGTHSLPKGALDMQVFQHRLANRNSAKMNDGSLSDTQTYSDVKPEFSSYALWLKHSSTTASRLSEGDSMESVSIVSSPGLSRNSKLIQSRDSTSSAQQQQQQPGQNSRLNRSNSIRSTKSEKMYPSMLSRGPDIETEPYYCLPVSAQSAVPWSQPTSPTPPSRGFTGLLSPTHNPTHRLTYPKKNDEVHGSQISLMSGGSSMYGSTTEEQRQANEVRRLKRELHDARDQVMSLSSQLSTNAHVVNAFEQSLQNMTNRLQQLTATTEKKESEITEMRQTIELLRKQSIQAGLTSAHMQSMGVQVNVNGAKPNGSPTKVATNGKHENGNGTMQRHHSTDSVCSTNSNGSNGSSQDKKKKKGWLRNSFTKAFSRNAKITKTNRQTSLSSNHSDSKSSLPPQTPQKHQPPRSPSKSSPRYIPIVENAKPVDSVEVEAHPVVEDLKKQLREKDMVLTDIRLEALTQASQMETLKETVRTMRQEMMNLKHNNERLQRMVTTTSLAGSDASLGCPASPSGSIGESRRYSLATDSGMNRAPLELPRNLDENEDEDNVPGPAPNATDMSPMERISISNEILSTPAEDVADPVDGKKIEIAVFLGQSDAFPKYSDELNYYDTKVDCKANRFDGSQSCETIIACTYISGKTTWQNLDYIVRKTFKDYLSKIDPGTNLGLNTDSITSYHLGEAKRGPEMGFPELLPCGYIIGSVKNLYICLQGVGSLAFESLIPRSIVHRYINLLSEHRRLILCGPSGTGKSYLARKLAEFLVAKSNRSPAESIATFNVDNKSSNLQQYLGTIAEQASMNGAAEELPAVIILDNLHHASALGDVFSCLLSAGPAAKLPCIIGTMSQATCNTTNLQLHHNFRWVLTANHMEPVKGFLGRYLRRRLFHYELRTGTPQVQMEKVYKWLPGVWLHTNTFLENHSSSDVTIGPQLFLECPLDVDESQKWFVDLWNHQLAPYLVDAIKEGVQLYGRRGNSWTDPCLFIRETYPWKVTPTTVPTLRQITADDVGLDPGASGNMDSDPLLNMLQMLQQAAASENPDQDNSDCASLDSNFTHESAGAEQ